MSLGVLAGVTSTHCEVWFAANVGLGEGIDGLCCNAKVTQFHLTTFVDQNV